MQFLLTKKSHILNQGLTTQNEDSIDLRVDTENSTKSVSIWRTFN